MLRSGTSAPQSAAGVSHGSKTSEGPARSRSQATSWKVHRGILSSFPPGALLQAGTSACRRDGLARRLAREGRTERPEIRRVGRVRTGILELGRPSDRGVRRSTPSGCHAGSTSTARAKPPDPPRAAGTITFDGETLRCRSPKRCKSARPSAAAASAATTASIGCAASACSSGAPGT